MCRTPLPDGNVVALIYDPTGGIGYRGEFLLSVEDRNVPVAVPAPQYLTHGAFNRTPDRLSYTETTAFRLEDQIARALHVRFDVQPKEARVAARDLVRQMVRAHPGIVSFSTEIPRWAMDVAGA